MADARASILGRIRAARRADASLAERERAAVEASIVEGRPGPWPAAPGEPVERFRAQALALSSTVDAVSDLDGVPVAVRRYLDRIAGPRALVCWPAFARLDWAGAGLRADARPPAGGDAVGLTGCFCALAETGTLVLVSGPDTPAATSLLPDTHVAIVPRDRIVLRMEQAFERMRAAHPTMPRAVHLVSGPSRTADIEQTVTLGAHGPYRVHVIVVG